MLRKSKSGYLKAAEDDEIKSAMIEQIFPEYITHEYERFYDMIENKQYAGAWFELRDVIEVIIKLPVLIGISYFFENDSNMELPELKDILRVMLTKRLSLGDWIKLAESLSDMEMIRYDLTSLSEILAIIVKFADDYEIIKWRNQMIGHGALPFEESDAFIGKMCLLSVGIDDCLIESIEPYNSVKVFFEDDILYARVDNKKFNLERGIFDREFFFDQFDTKRCTVGGLNYLQGSHKEFEEHWYKMMLYSSKSAKELEELRKIQLEDSCTWQDVMNLQNLNKPQNYIKNKKLITWLNNQMDVHSKGVFLLLMDRGMGKTAFVSSLNQLLFKQNQEHWYVRVYYCSSLKFHSLKDFVNEFNSLFKIERDARETELTTSVKQLNICDKAQDTAQCLKEVSEHIKRKRNNQELKLLFIIDGIDEIYSENNKKNIFDFIPGKDQLSEGVYILLTSRNGDEEALSEYTEQKLRYLCDKSITEKYNFSLKNENNKTVIKKMLRDYFDTEFFEELCRKSDYRFSDYRLYAEILNETARNGGGMQNILSEENALEAFFGYMRRVLGDKMYHRAGRILLIIATAYNNLTIGECIFLEKLEHGGNVVEVMAILQMFESFFVYKREGHAGISNNTVIKSANERYRQAVVNEFKADLMDELIGGWIEFIERQYCNLFCVRQCYDPECDYNMPEIYLYAFIYKYVYEWSENDSFKARIQKRDFIKAVFQYEKYMPTSELNLDVKELDIEMSLACIKLLEEQHMTNDFLLAAAYNNYVFHRKDIFFEEWGAGNSDPKAEAEKKEILKYCDKGISIAVSENTEIMELYSKLCSLKGAFLLKQDEEPEEVERLFLESYNITLKILEKDLLKGCNLYAQAAERVLAIWSKEGKKHEISQIYESIFEKINWLKLRDEVKPYLLLNSRNRIEFGILAREAMLYRKMADVCQYNNWTIKNKSACDFYARSVQLLKRIKIDNELTEQQERIIDENLRKVLNEYGRYEYFCKGDSGRAKELFEESTFLAERLIKINNIPLDKKIIQVSLYSIILSASITEEEKNKLRQRLDLNEVWIQKRFSEDLEIHQLFEDAKKILE